MHYSQAIFINSPNVPENAWAVPKDIYDFENSKTRNLNGY